MFVQTNISAKKELTGNNNKSNDVFITLCAIKQKEQSFKVLLINTCVIEIS